MTFGIVKDSYAVILGLYGLLMKIAYCYKSSPVCHKQLRYLTDSKIEIILAFLLQMVKLPSNEKW